MVQVPYHFVTVQQLHYAPPPGVAAPPATTCSSGVALGLVGLADHRGNITPQVPDLLNAALVVGVYPGDPLTQDGATLNSYEMSWREFSLKTTVSELAGGYLGRTAVYDRIHASEKGALSFQMGQVFSALIAHELAQTAGPGALPGVFMHLDRWQRVHPRVPVTLRTNRAPDFLSQMGSNSFQVWEAKCRNTHGVAWDVLRDGFSQAWSVAAVNGVPLNANIATLARTDPSQGNRWEVYVVDPGEAASAPVDPAARDGILRQYYHPFWGILKLLKQQASSATIGGVVFTVVPRPGSDSFLGLDARLIAILDRDQRQALPAGELSKRMLSVLGDGYSNPSEARSSFVNVNGILTIVGDSWLER